MIYDLLPTGKENAISKEELMRVTGYKESRNLHEQIERERLSGAIILSSTKGGYFKSESPDDIKGWAMPVLSRGKKTMQIAKLALQGLNVPEGQMEL